ncbi:ATP-binding cassette domain-containing protein [Bacillus suaedaesalsae]|uniref:ABC transporter ATP-binding protein n=1 Tax=Bacillus suaedaesalsae TaxID=2810349 RepID=A0ABS2DD36_9BACI|nr:ABC transporter ATP-binding protein [Bacillus suaedaesalsae]
MSFLTIENIHHTYFTKKSITTALDNISLSIEEGEFVSFLGPSGCGKTTLLSIIAGLIAPTTGAVTIDGKRIESPDPTIGYMFQQDYLFPWKTIEENILLGPSLSKSVTADQRRLGSDLLNSMDLVGVEKQFPNQLSGGMRQRAALVRTLMMDPKILLLDEPFSALDYQTKLKLENLVSSTLKKFNKTALLVTHDIGEAIAMSDRIFLLAARPGRVAKTFTVPEELRAALPFDARQLPSYSTLFQDIWKELDSLDDN